MTANRWKTACDDAVVVTAFDLTFTSASVNQKIRRDLRAEA